MASSDRVALGSEPRPIRPTGRRPETPIGWTLGSFAAAVIGLFAITAIEPQLDATWLGDPLAAERLGLIGATTWGISGLVAGHRAAVTRSLYLAPIALVLLAAACWSWRTFISWPVAGGPASLPTLVATIVAIALLAEGLARAQWLGVFCGLGAVGMTLSTTLVQPDHQPGPTVPLGLLVAVSAMSCLYGILVELEAGEYRSSVQLLSAKRQIELEILRHEELLHDLRSGLLSIEAAIASVDSDIVPPLRAETARLRRLTLTADVDGEVARFDLVPGLRQLVETRRAGGHDLELRTPKAVAVSGRECEVLAIAENLLSNATRHGRPPIVVELASPETISIEPSPVATLSVTDAGGRLPGGWPSKLFERGVTTHPGGRGIGLARAQRLAVDNGGHLTCGLSPDGRTEFILTLRSGDGPAPSAQIIDRVTLDNLVAGDAGTGGVPALDPGPTS